MSLTLTLSHSVCLSLSNSLSLPLCLSFFLSLSHTHTLSLRSLLGLLTASIMEVASSYQNVAFQLIRSIVDAKIIVPEVKNECNLLLRYKIFPKYVPLTSQSYFLFAFILFHFLILLPKIVAYCCIFNFYAFWHYCNCNIRYMTWLTN